MTTDVLPVGAQVRVRAGRALVGVVALGAAFTVFAGLTTQDQQVRAHSPWQDDPYDAVVSFTQLLVPVIVLALVSRAQLCRRLEPLPTGRLDGLVRAARTVTVLVGATVALDVVAVALGTHRSAWSPATVEMTVAALALLLASAGAWWRLREVRFDVDRRAPGPDWMTDAGELLRFTGSLVPPASGLLSRSATRVDRVVDGVVRPHPVASAALLAVGAGGLEALGIGIAEKGFGVILAFVLLVECSSIFSALVVANGYLRLVRLESPLPPRVRLLTVSVTGGCLALSLAVALRDPLWRLLGLGSEVQSLGQIWSLAVVAVVAGALVGAVADVVRH